MFTGIIEATAKVLEVSKNRLKIERPTIFDDIKIGSSIAVSGVCLSVIAFDDSSMSFDVVETTLRKTKLGSLKSGDSVNLERAMRADARFEGHIVTGHVEGVGKVVSLSPAPTPSPSPGPRFCGAAGGEGNDEKAAEDNNFNALLGRIVRGVGSLRFPAKSTVGNARAMRIFSTEAEAKLWQALRGKTIDGLYFRRQRPIGPYIVDFYCETVQLAVDVDGGYHQEEFSKQADREREENLRRRGIRILRCSNEDVIHRMDSVLDLIKKSASLPRLTEGEQSEHEVPGEGLRVGVRVAVPSSLLHFIVPHGSITLDGVALTVAEISGDNVSVALIPHTLAHTTLGTLKAGDSVNIETDILGKYILRKHHEE